MASQHHLEEEELIKKKLLLIKFRNKRSNYWYCRIYTGDKKYVYRSLKTEEKKEARDKAFEAWMDVTDTIKKTGSANPKSIRDWCNRWVKRQEDRSLGGNLSHSLYKAHRYIFETYVPGYSDYKGWKVIKDIPPDGWVEYRKWRMTEGWKLIGLDKEGNIRDGANRMRKPPKDSTVNREVTMIQEWFKYLLLPERLVLTIPIIEKTKQRKGDINANKAFSPEDYTKIQRRFRKWSTDASAKNPEWRQVVYHFFLISTNVGWRPDSEGLAMKWSQLKVRERLDRIEKKDEVGNVISAEDKKVLVAHLDIWDNKNKRWREGNFLGGEYFKRLKDLYAEWNKKDPSFQLPSRESLVFFNPKNGKRLTYGTVFDAYKDVLDSLGLKNTYTFYSCRSFYVTERLKEGVEVYTVAKQTGHSMEICKRHYEQLDIQSRADEATRRTYGKKRKEEGVSLF